MSRHSRFLITLVVGVTRLAALPRSLWEADEFLFASSIIRFDPLHHHPHPPGYPLIPALGKTLNLMFHDPFVSLVVLSFVSTVIGAVVLAAALCNFGASERVAVTATLIFYLSPAMLVHSTLPMSDPPAILFLVLALHAASVLVAGGGSGWAGLFGLWCAASIGCRPQYAVPILPMFGWVLLRTADWRRIGAAVAALVAACLAWLLPLVAALGGAHQFIAWETKQAGYVAAHDASLSRSGREEIDVILRFVAHPWGPKWLSFPILFLAGAGFVLWVMRRRGTIAPLVIFAALHLAFSLAVNDPADAVRYVLPALITVAFLAAFAADSLGSRIGLPDLASLTAFFLGLGSAMYVSPLLFERIVSDSPTVQAARFAANTLPSNGVIAYEQALKPAAEYLLPRFHPAPLDAAVRQVIDKPGVPLILLANGASAAPGARTFEWQESDAYGKLTRNQFRRVSVVPIPAASRYEVVRGVSGLERAPDIDGWRWLAPVAAIRLAPNGGPRAVLTLRLPEEAGVDQNEVQVFANGSRVAAGVVRKGEQNRLVFPVPSGDVILEIRSARSYVPSRMSSSFDQRRLAVQFIGVERG